MDEEIQIFDLTFYNNCTLTFRYLSIVRPSSPRLSFNTTKFTVFIIWFISLFIAFPTLVYSTTISYSGGEGELTQFHRTACLMVWPDGNPAESLLDHIYQTVFFLVTYVLPLVGLSITYSHLGIILWKDSNATILQIQQTCLTTPNRSQQEKRKVIQRFSAFIDFSTFEIEKVKLIKLHLQCLLSISKKSNTDLTLSNILFCNSV